MILYFKITVIGPKSHDIEIVVNKVHMGYQLMEFRSIKWEGYLITDVWNIESLVYLYNNTCLLFTGRKTSNNANIASIIND